MSLKVSILESASQHEMDDYTPHEKRHQQHFPSRQRYGVPALAIAAAVGFFLCYLLETTFQTTPLVRSSLSIPVSNQISKITTSETALVRPDDVKVIGLMFYGRAQFVNVLECYLRRNLRENGGWLDEVHFIANTAHEDDLAYLDNLINSTSSYVKVDDLKGTWTILWTYLERFSPETIFVKLDDDLVYMHDEAVPRIVTSLIAHDEAYAVGGHIVNTPHSQFWQYHTGALLPYLPDPEPVSTAESSAITTSWRASELPPYTNDYPPTFDWTLHAQPLHNKTRWLPLPPAELQNSTSFPMSSRSLVPTPAWNTSWSDPRGGWTMLTYAPEIESWSMAAQIHYSFLDHLEDQDTVLQKYNFLRDGQVWNHQWERYSVNFMAMRAGKMARQRIYINDEVMITMGTSKDHEEPFLIDTGALVSHFAFGTQHELLKTDVLERYLAYANEMVCPPGGGHEMITSNMTRTIHR